MDKLTDMKREAGRANDAITFNAINAYERSGNDATVLVKIIKNLYEENKKLRERGL